MFFVLPALRPVRRQSSSFREFYNFFLFNFLFLYVCYPRHLPSPTTHDPYQERTGSLSLAPNYYPRPTTFSYTLNIVGPVHKLCKILSAFSELSKLSCTVTSLVESSAYLTIDTSSRLLSVSRSSKNKLMRYQVHLHHLVLFLYGPFSDHHPITHRTVVYQRLLSIRQETNMPVNHMWTQWAYF